MPVFAISIMAILSLVGATLALGMDSRSGHQVQQAADAAALGGATAFLNTQSPRAQDRLEAARIQAKALAARNSNYELADLVVDAVSEDAFGQHTRLAVELQFEPVNFFSRFTGNATTAPIRRRAVASSTWGFPLCMLALNADRESGLAIKHMARLVADGCIVWSNAAGSESMQFLGGWSKAKSFCATGTADRSHLANVSPLPDQNCNPLPDPLADWTPPRPDTCQPDPDFDPPLSIRRSADRILAGLARESRPSFRRGEDEDEDDEGAGPFGHAGKAAPCDTPAGRSNPHCPANSATGAGLPDFDLLALTDNLLDVLYAMDRRYDLPTEKLTPGTYCGLDIAYGHVEMTPGTYFIKGAPMQVTRKATVTAEGVTLIFTGPGAYLRVSDEARMTLKAPTEGDLAGIAVAERRNTRTNGLPVASRLTGTGKLSIIGLIYLPTQNFFISGSGAGDQSSPLLQIVANRIAIRDTGRLRIDFEPGKTDVPVAIKPARIARLVE